MSDNKNTSKSGGADWFVQGILSKIGDIFDKMTGRGWQKSSSLSASELVERLKLLLDSEVKDLGPKGKFVPHNIKLKMQWNKFSTDSAETLKKLEYELLAAAIDHINDHLYHTYKPFRIEIKPDYFTDGVKFLSSFGEFGEDEAEAAVEVTVPQMKAADIMPAAETAFDGEVFIAEFAAGGKPKSVELRFSESRKRVSVGRTKENDLMIEDASISKIHAALVLNPQRMLLVADTGSTNGTFINGNRIAYGRAFPINEGDKLRFGNIDVHLRRVPKPTDFATQESYQAELPPAAPPELGPAPTIAAPIGLPPAETQPVSTVSPDNGQNATEAYSAPPPHTTNVPTSNHSTAIPIVPDFGFDDDAPKTFSGSVEPGPNTESYIPAPVNDETEVNRTEPRIKLNFDE